MSDRAIDINLTEMSDSQLMEEMKKRREEKKAKMVQILSRGIVTDRLSVDLPPDVYGEWFPNTKEEIFRAQTMGFDIDITYAKQRALHDDGTGERAIVGDVIFMTCPKETKEIIDEIRREQYDASNRPRGGKQKEERDFENDANRIGLPSELKSRVDSTTLDNIKDALSARD